ncbi:MAG: HIT family protein [Bacteroidota bacterium]|nr:HIT family protein [Flavisolibacter sp.]MDQ3050751.1 HIT family protein [Bacteroidota bacterium]
MATVFTKIVNGEITAYKVAENDRFLAFLDVNPLVKGHTLVIPKQEVDYIFDLEDEEYTAMMVFAKQVATGLRRAVPCIRIGVAVIGLEVPHAHIHLIPLNTMSDINFSLPKLSLPTELMEETAEKIRAEIKF